MNKLVFNLHFISSPRISILKSYIFWRSEVSMRVNRNTKVMKYYRSINILTLQISKTGIATTN